jgi:succinate-semialdehyde dehydrogenase/glutarate-semialdehyde dehydrogenase
MESGFSAYVFTGDPVRQRRLADALQYGSIGPNDVVAHHPKAPLGGWKESGIGTEGGDEILAPYQKTKFVSVR